MGGPNRSKVSRQGCCRSKLRHAKIPDPVSGEAIERSSPDELAMGSFARERRGCEAPTRRQASWDDGKGGAPLGGRTGWLSVISASRAAGSMTGISGWEKSERRDRGCCERLIG